MVAHADSTSPRIARIRRLELRVVTVPGSVKVVMRNVLLGFVGAPFLGGLSSLLRTPLTRSDTAFEIFSSTSGASSSGTHGDTDELMIQLRGGDVVLKAGQMVIVPKGVWSTARSQMGKSTRCSSNRWA